MGARFGKTFCSGPTNAAIDNFAARLSKTASSVVACYNEGSAKYATGHMRRPLIVRGYKVADELAAFQGLLQNPEAGNNALPARTWGGKSPWKLHLSVAFWMLVLLRSPATNFSEVSADDVPELNKIAQKEQGSPGFTRLRAVATGAMRWQEYAAGEMVSKDTIKRAMTSIVDAARFFCTTPALSCGKDLGYDMFKRQALAIAIDEAGHMHRADYYCVAGNSLLPCFLGGDPRQLAPAALSAGETTDTDGKLFVHRFSDDARISPLGFFQGIGIPVYRLVVQVRCCFPANTRIYGPWLF